MRLIDEHGEGCEARMLSSTEVIVRGCVGGRRPTILHPDQVCEMARLLPERRTSPRRVGPLDRRRNRRSDRRISGVYIGQHGRRRADALSWDDDLHLARAVAYVRRRTTPPTGTPA